jgi:two-component system chemotaxis sensor kinase CheA
VQLVVEGGDTAADKTIIEALGDPLLHILRNALDHGIETPDQRQAADKPTLATLSMRAYQEADRVVIEVADDGRGIDPARIRAAAVAKGLIDPAKAAALSDDEAMNLVFLPGSSTAAEVSDLSGRGVGMDAVRNAVEKLGGRVNLQSTLGRGTRIALTLPLSMAVTRVMIIEAAGGLYGVPMDLIVETVRIPRERIHAIKQSEAFVLRDRLVPLVRLAGLLREQERPREPDEPEAVLVCRIAERLVGLVIDQFRTGLDAVIKPLDGLIARTRGVSGTTLLGDGRVLLVLDLKELL